VKSQVRWLRISFVVGAVADGIVAILMLIPSRMGETGFTYAMGLGASLMLGWTLLLIWGYQRPVERKGLLLLTIFPVIAGLLASNIYQVASGVFPAVRILPNMVVSAVLIGLMGFSYFNARNLDRA